MWVEKRLVLRGLYQEGGRVDFQSPGVGRGTTGS